MADEGGRVYSDKKIAYADRLDNLLATLPKVLIIAADNVGSQQMHIVRAELRKEGQKAEILMGKNTMIKFVIRRAAASKVRTSEAAQASPARQEGKLTCEMTTAGSEQACRRYQAQRRPRVH
jgi:ferredoxin-NADP reductase